MLREQAGRYNHHAVNFVSDTSNYQCLVFSWIVRPSASLYRMQTLYKRRGTHWVLCAPVHIIGAPQTFTPPYKSSRQTV